MRGLLLLLLPVLLVIIAGGWTAPGVKICNATIFIQAISSFFSYFFPRDLCYFLLYLLEVSAPGQVQGEGDQETRIQAEDLPLNEKVIIKLIIQFFVIL